MKRLFPVVCLLLVCAAAGAYFFNQYWIHRYDALIERQASVYRLDPDLVWSVIYEETYFRPWKMGKDDEIGLMQVTPAVGREWAAATGMRDLERQMTASPEQVLRDPERNIQVGCWYLEKLYEQYRDMPGTEARMIAGYNAGPSRVAVWSSTNTGSALTTEQFISRIDIASTRAYVVSILDRYAKIKKRKSGKDGTPDPSAPSASRSEAPKSRMVQSERRQ
jgi:soluble lytic murein transglycosylase